jgi:hypothetical protein
LDTVAIVKHKGDIVETLDEGMKLIGGFNVIR